MINSFHPYCSAPSDSNLPFSPPVLASTITITALASAWAFRNSRIINLALKKLHPLTDKISSIGKYILCIPPIRKEELICLGFDNLTSSHTYLCNEFYSALNTKFIQECARLISPNFDDLYKYEVIKLLLQVKEPKLEFFVSQCLRLFQNKEDLNYQLLFKLKILVEFPIDCLEEFITFSLRHPLMLNVYELFQETPLEVFKERIEMALHFVESDTPIEKIQSATYLFLDVPPSRLSDFFSACLKIKNGAIGSPHLLDSLWELKLKIFQPDLLQLTDGLEEDFGGILREVYKDFSSSNNSQIRQKIWKPMMSKNCHLQSSTPIGDLPPLIRWKLGVDKEYHHMGADYFDRDESPGYTRSMENVWKLVDRIQPFLIDSFLLQMIHDTAVDGVYRKNLFDEDSLFKPISKGYRRLRGHYGLYHSSLASNPQINQLFKEWNERHLIYNPAAIYTSKGDVCGYSKNPAPNLYLGELSYESNEIYYVWSQFVRDRDELKVDQIFSTFYEKIAQAATDREKFEALSICCSDLQVFHPFEDGNGRTICFALCTLLLTQMGFPPAILSSPNVFEGTKTISQMTDEIEQGIEEFKKQNGSQLQNVN